MYHDFLGREIEDLEGENMRRDDIEWRKTHCGRCQKEFGEEEETQDVGYPQYLGKCCMSCVRAAMDEDARQMNAEREAEMRNEEILYGYELPRD